jgi:Prokaryotic membrane lipoprotein lipid attachment site
MRKYLIFALMMLVLTGCYKEPIDVYIDWTTYPDSAGRVYSSIIVRPCSMIDGFKKCGGGAQYQIGFADLGKAMDYRQTTSYDNYYRLQGKLKGTVKYKFRGKICGGGAIESNGGAPVEFHFECVIPPE